MRKNFYDHNAYDVDEENEEDEVEVKELDRFWHYENDPRGGHISFISNF